MNTPTDIPNINGVFVKPGTHLTEAGRSSPDGAPQGGDKGRSTRKLALTPLPADVLLMTRSDVAGVLRTTPRQISNMIARGQLPAPARVAGLGLRWRRSEIEAWIAAQ